MAANVRVISIEFGIPPLSVSNQDVVTLVGLDVDADIPVTDTMEVAIGDTIEDTIGDIATANTWTYV